MKQKLLAAAVIGCLSSTTYADPTVGIEFLWGLGGSAAAEGTNSKYCKNRSWGHLKGFGLIVSDDNIEAHVSNYNHDADPDACNRSNWAIGIGPKISSKEDDEQEDVYASWTPGIAYRFNETWRDHGHFSLFNRLNVGADISSDSDHQVSLELGYLQYGGFFEANHGEKFLTLGLSLSQIDPEGSGGITTPGNGGGDNGGGSSSGGENEGEGGDDDNGSEGSGEGSGGDTIVINDNDTITINDNDTINIDIDPFFDDIDLDYDYGHGHGWGHGSGWNF